MNHHPTSDRKKYRKIGYSCHKEAKGVGEQIMKEAGNEVCYASRIIEKGNESDVDISVSVDGTWQKGGFTSFNGCVVAISSLYYISLLSMLYGHKDNKKYDHPLYNKPILSHCLHGKTQNQNESFNGTIWKRVTKQCFIKLKIFEIGVYDSVAHFNVGKCVTPFIYRAVGIDKS